MSRPGTAIPLLAGLLFGALSVSCGKLEPFAKQIDDAVSCDEFSTRASFDDLKVQLTVREYMTAGVTYRTLNHALRGSVRTACGRIATDLGASDTWNGMGDSDEGISNAHGTGACDVANTRIAEVMDASAAANFAFIQIPGACHPDFTAQVACEAKCKSEATCDSGSVVTRCDPAELSVQCSTECSARAFCQGSAQADCNCMGKCESTCTGACQGTCTASDGTRTENNPNCQGKCSASCNGTCKGRCQMEVAANCGASASCKGGCTGTFSEPKCESEFTPPKCAVNADCETSCTANVAAQAICDPPHTELFVNVSIAADVVQLKSTLDTNLSALVAANVQGAIVGAAAPRLVVTGQSILNAVASLDAKTVSCATVAKKSADEVATSLSVTLGASAKVVQTCASRSL